jgi:hypothetical protein
VKVTEESGDQPAAEKPGAPAGEKPGAPAGKKPIPPAGKVPVDKAPLDRKGAGHEHEPPDGTTVIGKGWTSVFVSRVSDGSVEAEARGSGEEGAAQALEFLGKLRKVSGDWGSGRLMTGRLFTALLTDDGRLLIGAVSPERLYRVAADPAAALK